jgi:hypothetical protein
MHLKLEGEKDPYRDQIFGPLRNSPYSAIEDIQNLFTDEETRERVIE